MPGGWDYVRGKYEASLANATTRKGQRSRAVPDMDSWAEMLGVHVKSSKATQRDRRRLERNAFGMSQTGPGKWAPASSVSWGDLNNVAQFSDVDSVTHGRAHACQELKGRRTVVPEILALDGFISDLHGRLSSIKEGGRAKTTPAHVSSGRDAGVIANGRSAGVDGLDVARSSDIFGVPHDVIASAADVRRACCCLWLNFDMPGFQFTGDLSRNKRLHPSCLYMLRFP